MAHIMMDYDEIWLPCCMMQNPYVSKNSSKYSLKICKLCLMETLGIYEWMHYNNCLLVG